MESEFSSQLQSLKAILEERGRQFEVGLYYTVDLMLFKSIRVRANCLTSLLF